MQVFLTRAEIRRRLRASLGQTTDEGLGTLNRAQLDESIERACAQAHTDMRPERAQTEATFDLGIQQSLIEFPEDAGLGSLTEAAVWDAVDKRYCPLRRKRRGVVNADDQALAEGGDTMKQEVGFPRWISETRDGWQVFPTTDQAYKLRVYYQQRQGFTDDDEVSTVDAHLILDWALYHETKRYDRDRAQSCLADYEKRRAQLKAFEQTGARVAYDPDCTFEDEDVPDVPHYDTRPSRQAP